MKDLGPEPARVEVGTRHSEAPASEAGVPDIAPRLSRSSGGGDATLNAERFGLTENRSHFKRAVEAEAKEVEDVFQKEGT